MSIGYAVVLAAGILIAFAMGALFTYRVQHQQPPIGLPKILRRSIQTGEGEAAAAADAAASTPSRRLRL